MVKIVTFGNFQRLSVITIIIIIDHYCQHHYRHRLLLTMIIIDIDHYRHDHYHHHYRHGPAGG